MPEVVFLLGFFFPFFFGVSCGVAVSCVVLCKKSCERTAGCPDIKSFPFPTQTTKKKASRELLFFCVCCRVVSFFRVVSLHPFQATSGCFLCCSRLTPNLQQNASGALLIETANPASHFFFERKRERGSGWIKS